MRDERRVKRVLVSERLFLELFSPLGQCVTLRLHNPSLPADSKVLAVHADYSRRALCAIVESAAFATIPCGQEIPLFDEVPVQCEARYVAGDRLTPWKPIEVAVREEQENAATIDISQRLASGAKITLGKILDALGDPSSWLDRRRGLPAVSQSPEMLSVNSAGDNALPPKPPIREGQSIDSFLQSQGTKENDCYWGYAEEPIKAGSWLDSSGYEPFHFRPVRLSEFAHGRKKVALQSAEKGDLFYFQFLQPGETRETTIRGGIVPVTKNGEVVGSAEIGKDGKAKITVTNREIARELVDANLGQIIHYEPIQLGTVRAGDVVQTSMGPGVALAAECDGRHLQAVIDACSIPAEVVAGELDPGRVAAQTEAAFFRKSILAE